MKKPSQNRLNADQIRALSRSVPGRTGRQWETGEVAQSPNELPFTNRGEMLIKKGLSKTIDSRFITTLTRAPAVTQGNPYQVEVGLIFRR